MSELLLKPIAVTAGEPAGIGPDILIQLWQDFPELPLVVFADRHLLLSRADQLGLPLNLIDYDEYKKGQSSQAHMILRHVSLRASVQAGVLNVDNAAYVIETLEMALQSCSKGEFRALVTGPVNKALMNEAGISFSGHTEFFAQRMGVAQTVMLFVADSLKVALLTTHLPLANVSKAITAKRLSRCIEIIARDLKHYFSILNPRILVCGLNPHAGENGYLGTEEVEVIAPTLEKLRKKQYRVIGPVPADTAFTPKQLAEVDVVLAMYHDQGLPVVKYLGFGKTVNITLGLPILRTSVDHGTALNIAGTGAADPTSLLAAIRQADQCSQ